MSKYQGNLNEPLPEKFPYSLVATRGLSGSIANSYHKNVLRDNQKAILRNEKEKEDYGDAERHLSDSLIGLFDIGICVWKKART